MKANLTEIIKNFIVDKNYLSLTQIKIHLKSLNLDYADVSIKKSLKILTKDKIIFSAGRGYYSKISKIVELDNLHIEPIIKIINSKFPLLEVSVWSTKQINFAFHHLQSKFFTFIYANKDAFIYLRDHLAENGYSVYMNPNKQDLNKFTFTADNSLILRQFVSHNLSKNIYSPIEKILVDLYLEADRLNFIDYSEYEKVFGYFLQNFRLNISSLMDYAERRKILTKIKHFLIKYTNPTFV